MGHRTVAVRATLRATLPHRVDARVAQDPLSGVQRLEGVRTGAESLALWDVTDHPVIGPTTEVGCASRGLQQRQLARALRRLREDAGPSLEEAAPKLDWSTSKLGRIETAQQAWTFTACAACSTSTTSAAPSGPRRNRPGRWSGATVRAERRSWCPAAPRGVVGRAPHGTGPTLFWSFAAPRVVDRSRVGDSGWRGLIARLVARALSGRGVASPTTRPVGHPRPHRHPPATGRPPATRLARSITRRASPGNHTRRCRHRPSRPAHRRTQR